MSILHGRTVALSRSLRLKVITTQSSHAFRQRPAFTRTYFSVHHPDPRPFPEIQDRILSAAIIRVPEHGFTERALALGAKDAGYLDVTVQLFPRGVFDLINYHLVTQRLALKDTVQFPEGSTLGLGPKIRTLTMARLRANADIIHQWQGALGYMSLLENIPASMKELQALSDEIWYLAGDTAVDFSWYTKRASLAAVYASSELFMTTDTSRDFSATEEFLDRRLGDVRLLGGTVGGMSEYLGFWASNSVNLARSWGMRV
ncbi:rpsU-divergently transcribed protein [Fonsecaea monophora]|uniref:Ubiquinone biosynthesis protein n=1 Tax=Fonsecaea monophora TaxID=254056 RepID=A0A177EVS6_9EURO|nr:rpsU-divergently transcribed protein [Fonsecaea monophora]OAG36143.1 rpsU-divergently transcribed protein [Fonsecaea monophora]